MKNIYVCEYCGKEYDNIEAATACENACREAGQAAENRTEELKTLIDNSVTEYNKLQDEVTELYKHLEELKAQIEEYQTTQKDNYDIIKEYLDEYQELAPFYYVQRSLNNGKLSVMIKENRSQLEEDRVENEDKNDDPTPISVAIKDSEPVSFFNTLYKILGL